ncbi:MAG: YbfB/YjiJ family MFS transporter [Xanthobacteraceae bacterium]|nr:YbfB/YjiJ family MFS transporter [Xanthobacteraceae bacterium]
MSEPHPSPVRHPAWSILALSVAPSIGIGMGRFAYALVLPDMRESLGWSYATAGTMNTINAVGYLAGALLAAPLARRIGLTRTVWLGALLCILSLALCALSGQIVPFGSARLISGIGGGMSLVCGGALAAAVAQANPSRSSLLIGLFYIGPALGIFISGLISPFILETYGAGSWWIVWATLTVISIAMSVPLFRTNIDTPVSEAAEHTASVSLVPILPYLAGYFLFGAGYIAYMTFMIAYIRDGGGSTEAQSLFWCLIGCGGISAPFVWRRLMARGRSGFAMALMLSLTALGASLALLGTSPLLYAMSALLFGNTFMATTIATTAFARLNYPPAAWPGVIAIITVVFSAGQIVGPLVTGAITDITGSLSSALIVSAAALVLGAAVGAFQRPVATPSA